MNSLFSHSSGEWRIDKHEAVCVSKCNAQLPCPDGYFCNRLTGDLTDFGKCIKSKICPRSPPFTNGILEPDGTGVLGSRATFTCPRNKQFIMIQNNLESEVNKSIEVKCTKRGWKLADGSDQEAPICVRGKQHCIERLERLI